MIPGEHYIGLMSGTSLDAVDAVLADFSATPRLVASHSLAIPPSLRERLLALNAPAHDELRAAMESSVALADLYAEAVRGLLDVSGFTVDRIAAIGCHGQTVRHRPEAGYTLQLNQPARLAERSGITVVADFRSRDVAAGGQGAPLVPAFHDRVLRSPDESRVILNLGGIANLTRLAPGEPVLGFDTGPANALLDGWAACHLGRPFDADGDWAAGGQVDAALLERLLAHPFFVAPAPKSCGREEFSLDWVKASLRGAEAPQDVQATLAELTARSVAEGIRQAGPLPDRVLVCGGGARNADLMRRLAAVLQPAVVTTTDSVGVPGAWLEAFAFAWLARRCLHGEAGNLPAVTGARGPRALGAIYPA
ncbi:anhydro-N-acetylmuramic acid kinase [Uliginosibacterium sp. H1]|uniref:anhydro-N-acetylmuramic acid kinase n=1 Tax=Uliginosibacterium sp. H1 TaxID=3114757 RepID=UPI002E184262|nr:anhydro-N-acetylmuramic acid kinase [Uliginosibacterium sp. H1]